MSAFAAAALMMASGCDDPDTGPVAVSAIGAPPKLVNPNLTRLDPASAFLLSATAQGLVRFDPSGQIEPALAQSWTVTDDGLSYIFRIDRLEWSNGQPVTTQQVAARLQAAGSRASRNELKPLLGAIDEIRAMTDRVIEIRLKAPRPNFLQLLAQPEMAVVLNGEGTGPYAAEESEGAVRLRPRASDQEEEAAPQAAASEIVLRGEPVGIAVARFERGLAGLVIGGTAGDLAIARAAQPPEAALRFDPVSGLFGLAFSRPSEWLQDPEARRALSMAIDRSAIASALAVPDLAPRASLLPGGLAEIPNPAQPPWIGQALPARRTTAAALIRSATDGDEPPVVRVAMPDLPGHRLLFAYLRRDWRAIGVEAERVAPGDRADLVLIDEVAPASLATWYLRHFTCESSRVCSEDADAMLEAARNTLSAAERRQLLANADRLLTEAVPFIPLTAPVRWSLVSPRLTGFRTNPFGRHFAGALVAAQP